MVTKSTNYLDLLAKTLSSPLTLDHREGPTPIIGAEIIHAITSMALLGGGAASAVYRFFRSYDDGFEDGSIPVSRVFPLRQVIFGDPQVAEDFMRTQHKDGHPRYGSVFVNPKPPEDHKGRKIHGHALPSYEFGYAVEANELLTKAPGFSKKPWAQHVGLTRPDASVVFLSQTPGHEFFGSARGRTMSPSDMNLVISMLADNHPGIWQNRHVSAICPPNEFMAGRGLTRETFALSAGKVGAVVDTSSPEETITAKTINLALHRNLMEGSGEDEAWIGVYPANDDVPEHELHRMCGALKRVPIRPGLPSVNAEIVTPDKERPTLGSQALMVWGMRDSDVLATALHLQSTDSEARRTVVGLVRRPETAEQMGNMCGTPAYTIYSRT